MAKKSERFLLPVVVGLYLLLAWRFYCVCDDAYISFRYSRNLARGLGLRYNLGPHVPVEGYSNFLWVVVCAAFERVGIESARIAPLMSIPCGVVLLWRVYRVIDKDLKAGSWVAFFGALALATAPPFAVWASSGLATMPAALALFYTFEVLLLRDDDRAYLRAAISALALSLLRVEGVIWVLGIVATTVFARHPISKDVRNKLLRFSVVFGVAFAAYFAWHYSYFERPLPNTVYAKSELSRITLERGADYVVSFFLTFVSPLVFVPAAVLCWRGPSRVLVRASAFMVAGGTAYSIGTGGDWMPFGRFMVPVLPFVALLAAAWVQRALTRPNASSKRTWALAAVLVVVGVLPAFDLHVVPKSIRKEFKFRHQAASFASEFRTWKTTDKKTRGWRRLGLALSQIAEPNESLAAGAIGAVGYYSDLFVYDRFGLVTTEVSEREGHPARRSPGHDKAVPVTFFLDKAPTYIGLDELRPPHLAKKARRKRKRWSKSRKIRADYVVELHALTGDELEGSVFVVHRRRRQSETQEDADRAFQAFLQAHGGRAAKPTKRRRRKKRSQG